MDDFDTPEDGKGISSASYVDPYTGYAPPPPPPPRPAPAQVAPPGMSAERYNTFDQDKYLRDIFTEYQNSAIHKDTKGATLHRGNQGKTGYSIFGHDYTNDVINDEAFRSKYKRQGSETFDQWVSRIDKDFNGFSEYMAVGRGAKGRVGGYTDWSSDKDLSDFFRYDPAAEALAVEEKQAASVKEIEDFAAEMMKDLDENDPEVQNIIRMTSNRAASQARLAGVNGPMSIQNSELMMNKALQGYNMDRKRMGMDALSMKYNANRDMFNQRRMDQQQAWENRVGMQELQRSRDPGAFVAKAGGAVLGALPGVFTGNPMLAVGGASAGYNLGGAAWDGLSGGGNIPPPPRFGYSGN